MGLACWCFLRSRPGELEPLTRAAIDAFIFHEGRLPVGEDGLVRIFDLVVRLEDRRPVGVVQVGAHQYRALANGKLDREHMFEVQVAVAGVMSLPGLLDKPEPGVIEAGHHFAKRRLDHMSTWQPSDAERAMLRQLVNKKARRPIM